MDALTKAFKSPVLILLMLFCAAVAAPPSDCLAGDSGTGPYWHRPIFDGTTLCAWRRTWHGPNALETPLTGYYIPRLPDPCDCAAYANGCGEAIGGYYVMEGGMACEHGYAAECGGPHAVIGLEPAGFERLGHIPNDLELAGGLPAGGPARPGR